MSRKTTSDIVKTEIQALFQAISDKYDLPEGLISLGLAVLEKYRAAYSLDPGMVYELETLAERWGWSTDNQCRYFREWLQEAGVPVYQIGTRQGATYFVHFRDIMEAPQCLMPTKSESTASRRKDASSTTTAGRT